ncbi:MAG: hypothetical protein GXP45_00685 [bacterium]|nr:hypothetical protein [bacterium]
MNKKQNIRKYLLSILLIIMSMTVFVQANLPTKANIQNLLPQIDYKTIPDISNDQNKDSNTYIINLVNKLHSNTYIKTNKQIIQNFCNIIQQDSSYLTVGEGTQKFFYDPHQSLFILSLCTSLYHTTNTKYDRSFPHLQNEDGLYYKNNNIKLKHFSMPTGTGEVCDIK